MNICDLEFIINKFQLGSLENGPIRVYGSRGGSLLWRIKNINGIHVIKQLAPCLDLSNEKMVNKYELSEKIAREFAHHTVRFCQKINRIEVSFLI